jgi:alkaline phosphatase
MEQNALFHVVAQASDAIRGELCKIGSCDAHGVPVKRPERADLLKSGAK